MPNYMVRPISKKRNINNYRLTYISVEGKTCSVTISAPKLSIAWEIIEGFDNFKDRGEYLKESYL